MVPAGLKLPKVAKDNLELMILLLFYLLSIRIDHRYVLPQPAYKFPFCLLMVYLFSHNSQHVPLYQNENYKTVLIFVLKYVPKLINYYIL